MGYGIWRRASGAIKDTNGVWLARIAPRSPYRHRELERAIIRATSHDEFAVDYKNAQRVFQWIRASPSSTLRPFFYALSVRVRNTRSWAVALKSLVLLHGVFCCKVPAALRCIGRLPFDLSDFTDGHSKPAKAWPYSAFVRTYFSFLEHRAAYVADESEIVQKRNASSGEESIGDDLSRLRKLQNLLDLLIRIKPMDEGMRGDLIVDAMDCVIIEIFDVYSGICSGIASVLERIHGAGAADASMALGVLRRAAVQSVKLSAYFELCSAIGVLNAQEFPKVERVPEEDIREVERIITARSEKTDKNATAVEEGAEGKGEEDFHGRDEEEEGSRTVITEKWEAFDDEDLRKMIEFRPLGVGPDWSIQCQPLHHHVQPRCVHHDQVLPDLISF